MDKQLREQIKHDKFVEEVTHTVDYLQGHKAQVKKYGGVVAAVLVVAAGIYGFMNYQASKRQDDLRQATLVQDAFVGPQNPNGGLAYATQAEKDVAALKAYSDVASKHSGSREGDLARYSAATLLCDTGKLAECEAGFKQVAASSDKNTSSLGKLSLATLYLAQKKGEQAEPLLRELVANPTAVVSKEQAQIALARAILKTKRQEAEIILKSLQALDRPAVTRAAVGVLGEMMNQ
ncbi:MAG: tetratricopeptide repeat protein [Bryobacterales bacterium]|nr:tetratricopeptide repeat protein [Bryobacterales bacterium]